VTDGLVSAISRRLAFAQGEAIDLAIAGSLHDLAQHVGADAGQLVRHTADGRFEFVSTWWQPGTPPVPTRTDHKTSSFDWLTKRMLNRGAQIVDLREVVDRVGSVAASETAVRWFGVIRMVAGERVGGVLVFYFRREVDPGTLAMLNQLEILGDIMLASISRRDAEIALRASEARYRTIVETSGEGIWTVDLDWKISFANARMATMLGWSVDEIVGRPLLDFVADSASERTRDYMARRQAGITEVAETTYKRRDGTPVKVRLSASPLVDDAGHFVGALAMVEDVTEELRLQAELAGSRRLDAVGQLAGGVAHDINNALTGCLGYADKGQRRPTGGEGNALAEVVAAGERAAEVAHQLLAFARREPMQPRTLDAGGLVEGLEPMLAKLVGAPISVALDIAADRWLVRADASQLERVMLNLAANARDAMPDGGTLTIRVTNRTVVGDGVRVAAGDYVVVEVRDTGQGMTDDVLARVFEPFFTTKAERGGTGLGLASAYGAMKQLGGGIEITSTPGAGTQVLLFCPRSNGMIERSSAREPEAVAPAKRRILFVEDLEPLRNAIANALEDAGYTVVSAGDGDEALQLAEQDTGTFDALITDVVLPRKSGYRLARALREKRPELRVLYLSGYDRPQGLDEALALPGTAFLSKPFAPEAMIADLERLLCTE